MAVAVAAAPVIVARQSNVTRTVWAVGSVNPLEYPAVRVFPTLLPLYCRVSCAAPPGFPAALAQVLEEVPPVPVNGKILFINVHPDKSVPNVSVPKKGVGDTDRIVSSLVENASSTATGTAKADPIRSERRAVKYRVVRIMGK